MHWTMFNNQKSSKRRKMGLHRQIRFGFYKRVFAVSSLFCLLTMAHVSALPQPKDSVGVERKEGQLFILHKVGGGETLYSISRRYGAPVRDVISANENMNINELAIGDTLRVPYVSKIGSAGDQKILAVHEVQQSETLFSISRKYEVDVQEIRTWNQLGNEPLAIGQRLIIYDKTGTEKEQPATEGDIIHVVKQGETLYSISKAYQVSVDQLIAWNNLPGASIDLGHPLIVGKKQIALLPENAADGQPTTQTEEKSAQATEEQIPAKEEKKEIKAQRAEEKKEIKRYDKITEMGLASPIGGKSDTQKYLAMHRTAAVGTIMQVRNEMNNLSVFVRVVGKLPNTGVNDKITIRITQAAYESLGGINDRIPVEVSYIP